MFRCFFVNGVFIFFSVAFSAASALTLACRIDFISDSLGIFEITCCAAVTNGPRTPPTGIFFAMDTAEAFALWTGPDFTAFFAPAFRPCVAVASTAFVTA